MGYLATGHCCGRCHRCHRGRYFYVSDRVANKIVRYDLDFANGLSQPHGVTLDLATKYVYFTTLHTFSKLDSAVGFTCPYRLMANQNGKKVMPCLSRRHVHRLCTDWAEIVKNRMD